MADLNTNLAPYYDDFDPAKKFIQILALPGRAEQAREFTQAQTIMLGILKNFAGSLLREGAILGGLEFTFTGEDGKTVNVANGKIYLDGIVHNFEGGSVSITKVGSEIIGAKLVKTIVTEADDPSLKDPAQGYANYGLAGAHRIKAEVQLTLNDPTAATVYTFVDGEVQENAEDRPQLEMINQVLARRTYDESGNYKASGLKMSSKDLDVNTIELTVDAGKAYVLGYEVFKASPTRINIPKAQSTRAVSDEPKVYATDKNLYLLNNTSVKDITGVTATVEVTQNITRGSISGGQDLLPLTPVVSVVSVTQGATTYVAGTDYQQVGDRVDWSLSGAEPAIGSTYSVKWRYNKTMVSGTDYRLSTSGTNGYADISGGDLPVVGSTVLVDYDYYLARQDRIYIDKDGTVSVVSGQSDIAELVKPPIDADPYRLCLGVVELPPNSADVTIDNTAVSRVSMGDIYNILRRLDNLEYNQALSDLDNEAMQGQSATQLKGIFTDGFVGFSKADLVHPLYNASIDISEFNVGLPGTPHVYKPVVDTSGATTAHVFNDKKYMTLGYSEVVALSQPVATETMNVNPYSAYQGSPSMRLVPSRDNWVHESEITIENITTVTENIRGNWSLNGRSNISVLGSQRQVRDTITPYARQIDIEIYAQDFPANSDLIAGYIDGVKVTLTPLGATIAGSQAGTVKADSNGAVYCKFTIPAHTLTGVRDVKLANAVTSTDAAFTSEGIDRTVTTVLLERRVIYQSYDPLAQSFQLPINRLITSIDLFFSQKDTSVPVTVQIRDMENGFPSTTVLAEARLAPSDVITSSTGTVATTATFPQPVLCEANKQYCVVIMTTSPNYKMFIATLTQKDLNSNSFMTGQPYQSGVLFSSSNSMTWTTHQNSDLKFNLKAGQFNSNSVVNFQYISNVDIDAIMLNSDFQIMNGTSVTWEYQQAVNGPWYPITPNEYINLDSIINTVGLRATLTTTDPSISPVISGDNLTLVGYSTKTSGNYISKLVTTSQTYTTVKQIIEAVIPSGATVSVQLSTDDGATWVTSTLSITEPVDNQWTKYTYTYSVPGGTTPTKFRARLLFSTNNRTLKPYVRKLMNILT